MCNTALLLSAAGNSVCCNVHGFEPYFYISCLDGIEPDDIPKFRNTLEVGNFDAYWLIRDCCNVKISANQILLAM